jgi:hypothetical protein
LLSLPAGNLQDALEQAVLPGIHAKTAAPSRPEKQVCPGPDTPLANKTAYPSHELPLLRFCSLSQRNNVCHLLEHYRFGRHELA